MEKDGTGSIVGRCKWNFLTDDKVCADIQNDPDGASSGSCKHFKNFGRHESSMHCGQDTLVAQGRRHLSRRAHKA